MLLVVLGPRVQVDSLARREILERQVLRVRVVLMEMMDSKDHEVLLVILDLMVVMVSQERGDDQASLVTGEPLDFQGKPDEMVILVLLAQLATQVHLARGANPVQQESSDVPDLREAKERKVQLATLVCGEHVVQKVNKVLLELMEKQGRLALPAPMVTLETPVHQEHLERMDLMGLKDPEDLRAKTVNKERRAWLADQGKKDQREMMVDQVQLDVAVLRVLLVTVVIVGRKDRRDRKV